MPFPVRSLSYHLHGLCRVLPAFRPLQGDPAFACHYSVFKESTNKKLQAHRVKVKPRFKPLCVYTGGRFGLVPSIHSAGLILLGPFLSPGASIASVE